jgi:hypothetical protein
MTVLQGWPSDVGQQLEQLCRHNVRCLAALLQQAQQQLAGESVCSGSSRLLLCVSWHNWIHMSVVVSPVDRTWAFAAGRLSRVDTSPTLDALRAAQHHTAPHACCLPSSTHGCRACRGWL